MLRIALATAACVVLLLNLAAWAYYHPARTELVPDGPIMLRVTPATAARIRADQQVVDYWRGADRSLRAERFRAAERQRDLDYIPARREHFSEVYPVMAPEFIHNPNSGE